MIGSGSHVGNVDSVVSVSTGAICCDVSTIVAEVAVSIGKCSAVTAGYTLALSVLYALDDVVLVLNVGTLPVAVAAHA